MSSVRSPAPQPQGREQTRDDARRALQKKGKKEVLHYPFWFGGSASCFAACVTHPLDLGEFWSVKKFWESC